MVITLSERETEGIKKKKKEIQPKFGEEDVEEYDMFPDAEEERLEIAPADLLEKERPDLLEKEYGKNV